MKQICLYEYGTKNYHCCYTNNLNFSCRDWCVTHMWCAVTNVLNEEILFSFKKAVIINEIYSQQCELVYSLYAECLMICTILLLISK